MTKSIIEKLNIKPTKKIIVTDGVHRAGIEVYQDKDVKDLQQQRNELLEAMIETIIEQESNSKKAFSNELFI